MAWAKIYAPYSAGGLDLKSLRAFNDAAMLKLSWDMTNSNAEWVRFLKNRFFRHRHPVKNYVKSSLWPGVKLHLGVVDANSCWIIGNGRQVHFWLDNWLKEPLVQIMGIPPKHAQAFALYCGRFHIQLQMESPT